MASSSQQQQSNNPTDIRRRWIVSSEEVPEPVSNLDDYTPLEFKWISVISILVLPMLLYVAWGIIWGVNQKTTIGSAEFGGGFGFAHSFVAACCAAFILYTVLSVRACTSHRPSNLTRNKRIQSTLLSNAELEIVKLQERTTTFVVDHMLMLRSKGYVFQPKFLAEQFQSMLEEFENAANMLVVAENTLRSCNSFTTNTENTIMRAPTGQLVLDAIIPLEKNGEMYARSLRMGNIQRWLIVMMTTLVIFVGWWCIVSIAPPKVSFATNGFGDAFSPMTGYAVSCCLLLLVLLCMLLKRDITNVKHLVAGQERGTYESRMVRAAQARAALRRWCMECLIHLNQIEHNFSSIGASDDVQRLRLISNSIRARMESFDKLGPDVIEHTHYQNETPHPPSSLNSSFVIVKPQQQQETIIAMPGANNSDVNGHYNLNNSDNFFNNNSLGSRVPYIDHTQMVTVTNFDKIFRQNHDASAKSLRTIPGSAASHIIGWDDPSLEISRLC